MVIFHVSITGTNEITVLVKLRLAEFCDNLWDFIVMQFPTNSAGLLFVGVFFPKRSVIY